MAQKADGPAGPAPDGTSHGLRARIATWFERGRQFLPVGSDDSPDETDRGEPTTVEADAENAVPENAVPENAAPENAAPENAAPENAVPEDDALLTDEERVILHLERSGRTRQSELVEATDWSKAKVSRLLSSMEEEGAVCRTPVGREKIVTLPGSRLEAEKSPFEAEKSPFEDETGAPFEGDEEDSRAFARQGTRG